MREQFLCGTSFCGDLGSRVRVDLCPDSLNLLSLLLRLLSVARSSLESLGSQALVHVAFDVTAHAHSLPQEALSMAFVKSRHDLFAPCHGLV